MKQQVTAPEHKAHPALQQLCSVTPQSASKFDPGARHVAARHAPGGTVGEWGKRVGIDEECNQRSGRPGR